MAKPTKKEQLLQIKIDELTTDVQRLHADFENYRKRTDVEKTKAGELAKAAAIMKLLPIIDTIERAIIHAPQELADNTWVQGVVSINKNFEKSLSDLGLVRIDAAQGTTFDPHMHEAVSMTDAEGDHEIIAEELRAGYKLDGQVIRPAMVKVTKQ